MTFVRKRSNILRELEVNPYVFVTIDGKRWDPIGLVPGGYELQGSKPGEGRFLFQHEFERLRDEGRLDIFDNPGLFSKRFNIVESDRDTMFLRFFWVQAVEECIAGGVIPTEPKERHMNLVIEEKTKQIVRDFRDYRQDPTYDHGEAKRKAHGGSVSPNRVREAGDLDPEKLVFTTKTLLKHFRKWKEKRDLWDLLPESRSHGMGGPKIDPRTQKYVDEHITLYEGEILANPTGLTLYINAHIENDNLSRAAEAEVPLVTRYTVDQAIRALPRDRVIAGRQGNAAARQELRHIGDGPSYKRLGEMVQFDCWNTHVFSILNEAALEEVRKRFADVDLKRRITLSVAVEMASGCFLAIDGGYSETAVLTHRTLRMLLSDKSVLAKSAGCECSWHMRLAPEGGISDWGPGYKSQLFLTSAMSIFDRFTYAAAGRAHLRGFVERTLRTMDVAFVRRFLTGGTRSNVREKGEYEPEKRAQVFFHELLKMITKYIVDVHHHLAPTRGGLSPRRKYDALFDRQQPKPLPNRQEIRLAFGVTDRAELNRAGLRYQGILYWNSWLEPVLHKGGVREYWIKVDPEDIGAISVLIGSDWTTIEGPKEFNGVRLDDWVVERRRLRALYGEQARIDFREIVAPAIVELAQKAQEARAFHNIHDVGWTSEKLRELEHELRSHILFDRDPKGPEEGLMRNGRLIGTVHTRSQDVGSPINFPPPPSQSSIAPLTQVAPPRTGAVVKGDDTPSPLVRSGQPPSRTRRPRKHIGDWSSES